MSYLQIKNACVLCTLLLFQLSFVTAQEGGHNCPQPTNIQVLPPTSETSVTVSWTPPAGGSGFTYQWFIVPNGVNPVGIGSIQLTGITASNSFTVVLPSEGAGYQVYVQTICQPGLVSPLVGPINLVSTPCDQAQVVLCGVQKSFIATGPGLVDLNCLAGGEVISIGSENYFKFVAPATKKYTLSVNYTIGGPVSYYTRKAKDALCDPTGWLCLATFNQPGTADLGTLQAGEVLILLADATTVLATSQAITIGDCLQPNDIAANATLLGMNTGCSTNTFSNISATKDQGEPDPDIQVDLSDLIAGRWSSPVQRSVWFKFKAPASGTISVSLASVPAIANFDTRVAIYEVGDSSKYSTFKYINSDEGNSALVPPGINPAMSFTGLTPNKTYYLQVDGGTTALPEGVFCITLQNGLIRTNISTPDCKPQLAAFVPGVNGLIPNGDRWYGIYNAPSPSDMGEMVAAIKPNAQNLDTVWCQVKVNSTPTLSPTGVWFMPAYYRFRSKVAPVVPVKLRLFYTYAELDSLKKKTGLFQNTAADLNVSQYIGQSEDCSLLNNSSGASNLITAVDTIMSPFTRSFFLEFSAFPLGEFGAHFGNISLFPLPVELVTFKGSAQKEYNLLEWRTASEKDIAWYIIERSTNGTSDWAEVGRRVSEGDHSLGHIYDWEDLTPLKGTAYYRLRIVESDNRSSLSYAVVIKRVQQNFEITQLFPSPAHDYVQVRFEAPAEGASTIDITDQVGRLVASQRVSSQAGQNQATIDLTNLPKGVYLVRVSDGSRYSAPMKLVVVE